MVVDTHRENEVIVSTRQRLVDFINRFTDKKKEDSRKGFLHLESELSKAVSKGVYKKNTASRIISRLSQKLKLLTK